MEAAMVAKEKDLQIAIHGWNIIKVEPKPRPEEDTSNAALAGGDPVTGGQERKRAVAVAGQLDGNSGASTEKKRRSLCTQTPTGM